MTFEEKLNDYMNTLTINGFTEGVITKETIASTPAGINEDSGVAYKGAMVDHAYLTFYLAKNLMVNPVVQGVHKISEESLKKVIYFQHLSKTQMFVENTNDWEVSKRGLIYTFNPNSHSVLKAGERSIFIAMNAGVTFTEEEFEAMRILDKDGEEFEKQKFMISPLSLIVKQANELAYSLEKARHINK